MKPFLTALLLALGLFLLLPAGPALAQCTGLDPSGEFQVDVDCPVTTGGGPISGAVGEAINSGVTKEIVHILEGANKTCERELDLRYRIDCLRIYYQRVADRLPATGDYLPIKQAMEDAAAKLDAIVAANLDESAPALRPREGHKPQAKRLPAIRPVKAEAAVAAAAQAAEVVKEAELIIIRSGGDPARRTEAYTDVAAAVEDNLVILRSA
jgi:hypothetical protein